MGLLEQQGDGVVVAGSLFLPGYSSRLAVPTAKGCSPTRGR